MGRRKRFPIDYFPKAIRTDDYPGYRFAIIKVFSYEVKHDKVTSFKHGNNVIENFFRYKRRFPKFRNLESARKYVGHYISEVNGNQIFGYIFIIRGLKEIQIVFFIYSNYNNRLWLMSSLYL